MKKVKLFFILKMVLSFFSNNLDSNNLLRLQQITLNQFVMTTFLCYKRWLIRKFSQATRSFSFYEAFRLRAFSNFQQVKSSWDTFCRPFFLNFSIQTKLLKMFYQVKVRKSWNFFMHNWKTSEWHEKLAQLRQFCLFILVVICFSIQITLN